MTTPSATLTSLSDHICDFCQRSGSFYLPDSRRWICSVCIGTLLGAGAHAQTATPHPITDPILAAADKAINGDRRVSYGEVEVSFERIAKMWTVVLKHPVNAHDVSLCMIALKLLDINLHIPMPRYRTATNGQWIKPVMKGYLMKCCDCGLVHRMDFKVIRWGRGHKVMFRAFRLKERKRVRKL